MSTQFEITAGGSSVPAGLYRAKFVSVEPSHHEEFGDGLKWSFEVLGGDHSGETASRITNAKPTLKNAAGRMISGITGENLTAGARLDVAPFIGREYLLKVEATQSGATRIETVLPAWK